MISSVFCRFVFGCIGLYIFMRDRVAQGHNEKGQRGMIPRAPNYYGGAKSLWEAPDARGGLRRVPTMSQVLSSIQYICFRKSSGSNMGHQTYFLPRAPSNLVTPLVLAPSKISSSCRSDYLYENSYFIVIVTTYFMKQTSTIQSVDTELVYGGWKLSFSKQYKI